MKTYHLTYNNFLSLCVNIFCRELFEPEKNDVVLFKQEGNLLLGKVSSNYRVFTTFVSVNSAKIDFKKRRIPKSKLNFIGIYKSIESFVNWIIFFSNKHVINWIVNIYGLIDH